MRRASHGLTVVLAMTAAAAALAASAQPANGKSCRPSSISEAPNDSYRPGSPVRSSSGKGHVLSGAVLVRETCRAIARARIEFFQSGPSGQYSNGPSWAGRATVVTRADGSYRYESLFPSGGRPHIHMRVSAPGFKMLHTTYFAKPGRTNVRFSFVLEPAS